jgi:Flp pilus assembly protein TadD
MTLIRFLVLLLLLCSSVGPGLWLVRRFNWSPPERLCAAIAASGIILYLTSSAIYVLRLPRFSYFAVSLACLGFAAASRAHGRLLLASREVRWALGGFALLFVWALTLLAMVRNYSGAGWAGDWFEHYQRTQFFLEHQPKGTLFGGVYALPARPPFMNLLGTHFLAQVGERYDLFQVVFTFFNLLAFFPCCLIARLMVPRAAGRSGHAVLLCLLAASPLFLQNATYVWTKGLANFYVLTGLWFYLRGWRKSDPIRLAASSLALSAAVLVHYSAIPYAILLLLHFGLFVLPKHTFRIRQVIPATVLPGAVLLGTWLAWSIAEYGAGTTFSSNTTAQAAGKMSLVENVHKIALNLFYSIVPHPLHLSYSGFTNVFFQPNGWGFFRDYFFTIAQTNLVFGMGCLGGPVVLFLLWRLTKNPTAIEAGGHRFWLGLVSLGAVFTVATHPDVDVFGVAHVCSQPLLLLGLTFLAASFGELPWGLRVMVVLGCVLDFIAGIFVHFSLQEWSASLGTVAGRNILGLTTGMLNPWAVLNVVAKDKLGYFFWGDHFAGFFPILQLLVLALFCAVLFGLIGVIRDLRPTSHRAAALWGLYALPLGLGAFCISGIRAKNRPIVPNPPELDACIQAARRNSDSSDALYNLGLSFYENGHIDESLEQWTEAFMLRPNDSLARYFAELIAKVYGIPVPANLAAAEGVHLYPNLAGARVELAAELMSLKHPVPAVSELERAVQLEPSNAKAYIYLGWLNLQLGRLTESVSALNSAVQLDPKNPEIHYMIAGALYKSGQTPEAIGHLREALALKPDFLAAQAALRQIGAPLTDH